MTPSEASFPRHELAGPQRDRVRDLLVQQATAATPRHRRVPVRFVVPAAALALVVAVAGVTGLLRAIDGPDGPARPSGVVPTVGPTGAGPSARPSPLGERSGPECIGGDRAVEPEDVRDLDYRPPAGSGYSQDIGELGRELWCSDGTHPVVTFVRPSDSGKEGTISAAVTVIRLDDSPEKLAEWPNVKARFDPPDEKPATKPVTVRGRPGTLVDDRTATWPEPGGDYWRVSGSGVEGADLLSIAEALTLNGTDASWPAAGAEGFEILAVPQVHREEHGLQPYNWVEYDDKGCDMCLSLTVSPGLDPWQGSITELRMPVRLVDVNGQPGVLAENGVVRLPRVTPPVEVKTQTPGGAQMWISEDGSGKSPSDLLDLVRSLEPVDDSSPSP
jgi:hypothetical protein